MTAIEVALLLIGVIFIIGSFFIIEKLSPTELSRVSELSEDELRIVMDRELEITGAKISDMADQAVDLSMNQIQRKMEKDTNEKIMAISEYSDLVMEKLQKFNNEVTFLYSMLGDKHAELNESMEQLDELLHACQTAQVQPASVRVQPKPVQTQPTTARVQPKTMQTQPTAAQVQPTTARVQPTAQQEPSRPHIPIKPEEVKGSKKVSDEPAKVAAPNAPDEVKQPDIPANQEEPEAAENTNEAGSVNIRETILERYRSGEDLKDVARDLGIGYGEVKLIVELYKGEENL